MATIKIDKGIKMPPSTRKDSKYPWRDLKTGDSFFLEGNTPKGLYSAAASYGLKIAIRRWEEGNKKGVRVWKLGDVTPKPKKPSPKKKK